MFELALECDCCGARIRPSGQASCGRGCRTCGGACRGDLLPVHVRAGGADGGGLLEGRAPMGQR